MAESNFYDFHQNQNKLPLKKRFGIIRENLTERETKEENRKAPEDPDKLKTGETKQANIIPGVIRHGSCPNNTLAYYYNYAL